MKQLTQLRRLPLTILIVLHAAVLVAGFLCPYDPATQNRTSALVPPTAVHFVDSRGVFHPRPFVVMPDGTSCGIRFFVRASPYRLAGAWTVRTHLFGVEEPGRIFLLGTDELGRDQFSRMLWGGQISLTTGWLAALLTLSIGLLLGSTAGFWGGWPDALIMRGADLFLAVPWIYLLLAVRAFLPLSMPPHATAVILAAIIGAVGWARPARLVRGIVLSAREREFVYAARGFGASPWYLMRRHCLPATYSVLATQAALLIPQYMVAETTLSFVGLGVAEPQASWGTLLAPLRQISLLTSSWWVAIPALLVVLTSWCFLNLDDSLADGHQRKA